MSNSKIGNTNISREDLLVLHEKHGADYVPYTVENLRAIIIDRTSKGYYHGEDRERAYRAAESQDEWDLRRFIVSRNDYEYEGIQFLKVRQAY
jgi:hypothetical protein